MSYEPDPAHNPYAAPTAGAEVGGKRSFALADEVRRLISTTATLMIVAGILQIIPGIARLVIDGFSAWGLLSISLFGIIPAFTAIAGFSLRTLNQPGDDLGALLSGFRQLFVAFLIKGIVLLTVIGLMLLSLAFAFLGVGKAFFNMWG
jgi:hypothetical protein